MTVNIAVTNNASIWTRKRVPRIAKMPTTTMTSWSRATRAAAPNLTLPNRMPTQIRMPSEPSRMSSTVLVISSLLMSAPTVVVWRVQAIGPILGSACMAAEMSASLPVAGRSSWHRVVPFCSTPFNTGAGEGVGLAVAVGLAATDAEADALADGAGVGLSDGDAVGDGELLAAGDPLADAEGLGVGVGGTGVGCGKRVSSLVRTVKYLAESCVTSASATPNSTKTALT